MKCIIDKSIVELGITSVVIGVAKNIDPHAKLSDAAKRRAQYQKVSADRSRIYSEHSAPRFYAAHQ